MACCWLPMACCWCAMACLESSICCFCRSRISSSNLATCSSFIQRSYKLAAANDRLLRFIVVQVQCLTKKPHGRNQNMNRIGQESRLVALNEVSEPGERKGEGYQEEADDPVIPDHSQRREAHGYGDHVQGAIERVVVRAVVMRVKAHGTPRAGIIALPRRPETRWNPK